VAGVAVAAVVVGTEVPCGGMGVAVTLAADAAVAAGASVAPEAEVALVVVAAPGAACADPWVTSQALNNRMVSAPSRMAMIMARRSVVYIVLLRCFSLSACPRQALRRLA
jgi:hypothetical protein